MFFFFCHVTKGPGLRLARSASPGPDWAACLTMLEGRRSRRQHDLNGQITKQMPCSFFMALSLQPWKKCSLHSRPVLPDYVFETKFLQRTVWYRRCGWVIKTPKCCRTFIDLANVKILSRQEISVTTLMCTVHSLWGRNRWHKGK